MPGFYADGEYDLAGFIVGVVARTRIVDGRTIAPGDVLIGIPSAGLHTNGYSLARRVFFETAGLQADTFVRELGATAGAALLAPHRSYLSLVRPLLERGAWSRVWRISQAAASLKTCRYAAGRIAQPKSIRTRGPRPLSFSSYNSAATSAATRCIAPSTWASGWSWRARRDSDSVISSLTGAGEWNARPIGVVISGEQSPLHRLEGYGCLLRAPPRHAHFGSGSICGRSSTPSSVDAQIVVVISKDDAQVDAGAQAGIETVCLKPRDYAERDDHDRAVASALSERGVDRVSQVSCDWSGADARGVSQSHLNIHPSLLPSFPGLEAQRQALEHGVRVSGATVHLVTSSWTAAIVLQAAVPVLENDTVETLASYLSRSTGSIRRDSPGSQRRLVNRDGGWSKRLQRQHRFRRTIDPDRRVGRAPPRLTNIAVRCVGRCRHPGNFWRRWRRVRQHDLPAMCVTRQHERNIQGGRFGQAPRIVRQ